MPGLSYHVKVMETLIPLHVPILDSYLVNEMGLVTHQIYLHDWIICMFTSVMPIGNNIDFLCTFFEKGWPYFYTVALCILKVL